MVCLLFSPAKLLAEGQTLELPTVSLNIESIASERLSVNTQARLLWLPSEYGVLPQERQLAEGLVPFGIESWFVDIYEAMFLSPTASAVDEVPTELLVRLIQEAQKQSQQDNVPLWIIAPNKSAQLALRGLVGVQQTPQNHVGLILLNPNLYLNTPKPGKEAEYWSQVKALNLPVSILQAEQSPWRWRVTALAEQLKISGSDVFVQIQQQARDRFYFRPDALPEERHISTRLADKIRMMMRMQLPYLAEARQAGLLTSKQVNQVEVTRSVDLQRFEGKQGRELKLQNLQDQPMALNDFKGQVVLLNFWASWCPPCVHEMPSMARLKNQLQGEHFEILAVNLAEPKAAIQAFIQSHPVNFPILLDPSGSAVKSWQVFAYPSTYLIDQTGQIRYALFGGTEWDEPQHVEKIKALLAE